MSELGVRPTNVTIARIDGARIRDWETFHSHFAEVLGFPGFYGRNMNAWIDCVGYADEPSAGMITATVPPGGVLTLHVDNVESFAERCPEQYEALVTATAFVNWRRVEDGHPPIVALSYYKR